MKKFSIIFVALMLVLTAGAQTLNVKTGSVTYLFPAVQTGDMVYENGTMLTIMGKQFAVSEIDGMTVDDTAVTDNTVSVTYNGLSASVVISGNVAQYLTPEVSGAHVSIAQSDNLAEEITYTLTGETSDGEFYMSGSYKATVELNGLTLTNTNPVYSGAAIHIQNGKRIKVKPLTGTVNTLVDAASGSQKGCLYVKGHAEFAQKGTLNVRGRVKHAIKTGEYMSLKNATINVIAAEGDGINCAQFFLMESGAVNIVGTADDGIQCDLEGDASTGVTTDHEDEDTGNIYIEGGSVNIAVTANAAKGIKSEGDMTISDGDIIIKTSGGGIWDTDKLKTKASACLGADGNMTISGGTLNLISTGAGGKGINADGAFTATGGSVTIKTSGNAVVASSTGSLSTVTSSQMLDRYDSDYKSSPKGIKVDGAITISDDAVIDVTTTGAGGEGIESKYSINITGGQVIVNASDDAINASYNTGSNGSGDLTISGGYVYARSTGNDGIDTNGNCYIKGGLVYAIGASSPEVAVDANTEQQKKLYVTGGTIVAIGGLERGSSLSQSCYSTQSWNRNTWYVMTWGNNTFAFKTPASGGNTLVVSAASTPTLKSDITQTTGTNKLTLTGGTTIFGGVGILDPAVSGGVSVSLSNYTGNSGGGPGGGGWPGGGW